MGYPKGEIPMLDVHGEEVAGATFPVPIWHEYMAAALWHHKVLGFELPNRYPTWHYLTHGNYGSFGYYPTRTYYDDDNHDDDDRSAAEEPGPHDGRDEAAGSHHDRDPAGSTPDASGATASATDDDSGATTLPWPSPVARSPRAY